MSFFTTETENIQLAYTNPNCVFSQVLNDSDTASSKYTSSLDDPSLFYSPAHIPTLPLPMNATSCSNISYSQPDVASYTQDPTHYPPPSHGWLPQSFSTDTAILHAVDDNCQTYPAVSTVHAPVPLPSRFSYLPECPATAFENHLGPSSADTQSLLSPHYPVSRSSSVQETSFPPNAQQNMPLEYYGSLPQKTFPTPSELLVDLSTRDTAFAQGCASRPDVDGKAETQRKARHRAMAESVGFPASDPDKISSHDKKRHFLECLEHYVVYLHEQLRLVSTEPIALERVSSYRGLSSRSMRTLLVHMENTLRKRNLQTVEEERSFLALRHQVLEREALAAQSFRRHSIADGVTTTAQDLHPMPY